MSYYVGIVRSNVRLKRALDRLFILYRETEELYNSTTLSPQLAELRNLITIAYLITRSAATRKESRGLHFTTDYPNEQSFVGCPNCQKKGPLSIKAVFRSKRVKNGFYTEGSLKIEKGTISYEIAPFFILIRVKRTLYLLTSSINLIRFCEQNPTT
jgi:hypothetical protein